MKPRLILQVFLSCFFLGTSAYDGYSTCSKPLRSSKSRAEIPCDFKSQNWCTVPGSVYPWRAVRRFVYENHGLMRRMYGEERHISVLRSELDSNDVDYQSEEKGWGDFHEAHYKYNKPHGEMYKSSATSTTSPPLTASPTAKTTTVHTATTTGRSFTPNETTASSESSTVVNASAAADFVPTVMNSDEEDVTTTDASYSTTTLDYDETTVHSEGHSSQQIFQDIFDKSQMTTEESLLYKLKGVNACPVKDEVVAPFWANNTRGEVLALLNLYPFEQYVHWERCTFENKQMFCRQGCRCEQQYRLHRLLAYDPSNDCRGIFSDWFKFPSCCVCRCYDLPNELRITSRSPRSSLKSNSNENPGQL